MKIENAMCITENFRGKADNFYSKTFIEKKESDDFCRIVYLNRRLSMEE
jgi:hypothetical protein